MGEEHHGHDGPEPSESHHRGHDAPRGYTEADLALPGGLSIASNGLRLEPATTHIDPGEAQEWTYRVVDRHGDVVTSFEETHEQLAHLILVRRDLSRFQHLHPRLNETGTWTAKFTLEDPGVYRAFVDVLVAGQPTTLGVDLFASGTAEYETHSKSTHETSTAGYDVAMTPESVPVQEDVTLEFAVRRDGDPVGLDPYLGALGHLVALREGDLAYLHVHPEATDPTEGIVRFLARFPTPGRYRLFLQAKPDGTLVTVPFDVTAGSP